MGLITFSVGLLDKIEKSPLKFKGRVIDISRVPKSLAQPLDTKYANRRGVTQKELAVAFAELEIRKRVRKSKILVVSAPKKLKGLKSLIRALGAEFYLVLLT